MAKQLDAFGADLCTSGLVLQPYKTSEYQTFEEIIKKDWPTDFRKRLAEESVTNALLGRQSRSPLKCICDIFHDLSHVNGNAENLRLYLKVFGEPTEFGGLLRHT